MLQLLRATTAAATTTCLALALASPVRADVRLPAVFGDHMVLQRDAPVPVWGWAAAGERVTVSAGGESANTTASPDGTWRVTLPKLTGSDRPLDVTVDGTNTVTLHDVLVGDVWVCSGQSNMQFQVGGGRYGFGGVLDADREVRDADHPTLRLFVVPQRVALDPQADCQGSWKVCTPETAARFSAVGYFFGRDVQADQHVPVGLIDTSYGGTVAQAWISLDALKAQPALAAVVGTFRSLEDNLPALRARYAPVLAAWAAKREQALKDWDAATAKAKADGTPLPPRPAKGGRPVAPDANPNTPTVLSNAMVAPLVPYAIKGVIWYQGESNAADPKLYQTLFPTLIRDWRDRWGQGDFPFLWVQLAGYQPPAPRPGQAVQDWPGLREAQSMALRLPNTGQAVAVDIGQGADIHPKDKVDVGHRLALAARAVAYGEPVAHAGPTYRSMTVDGDRVRVTFADDGGGLTVAARPTTQPGVPPVPARLLTGFTIAGADHRFVPATATIDGDTVLVTSPDVHDPRAVRYAWADDPACDLYDQAHLPAAPFRTDDWADPVPADK